MKTNKILKATAMVMAIIMMVGVFTACSNDAGDKDEQGRTVISVGKWPQTQGVELDNIEERRVKFEAENPDVVIQPDAWQFDLKTFYAKAAGGQLPTLFETHYTEIEECIASGYSADMTKVLNKRGYEGMINPNVLEVMSDDEGKVYGMPISAYVLGLGYNTELFEKAGLMEADGTPKQPKDWNEVVEFGKKIKEATGKPGFAMPTMNNAGGWIFSCIAWSFGVDFMEKDENGKWQATFDTPEAAEALQFIKDMKWKHDIFPAHSLLDNDKLYQTYGTDGAGMILAAGSFTTYLPKYNMDPNKVGIMALPAGPKRHVTLLGGRVYSIAGNATEDQIDASLRWIETTQNYKLTEDFKESKEKTINEKLAINEAVGVVSMSVWSEDTESFKYESELIKEKSNINLNHVKLYNEFVLDCPADIQPEEPVCAQELYGILDGCIQEVLTNENADCGELMKKACSDFQSNYLNNL